MLEYDTTPNIFREELIQEPLDILDQVKKTEGFANVPEKVGLESNEIAPLSKPIKEIREVLKNVGGTEKF